MMDQLKNPSNMNSLKRTLKKVQSVTDDIFSAFAIPLPLSDLCSNQQPD